MHTPILAPIIVAALLLAAAAQAQPAASAGAAHGRTIFIADGCYQCHGVQGQGGGPAGPKLAPQPLTLEDFTRQLRQPRDTMPVYTAVVLPDSELQDIYAYMQSIPKAKTVAEIPLLNR